MVKLLFIDDDTLAHRTLKNVLPCEYTVCSHIGGIGALEAIRQEEPEVVLLDIDMPDRSGLSVLRDLLKLREPPPVVMLTALRDTRTIVQAMKAGAFDYITKPYALPELVDAIRRALESRLKASRPPTTEEQQVLSAIVGVSPAMDQLRSLLARVARADSPLLILGESGTGKDLAARVVHRLSGRSDGPYHSVNCAAIPEQLFETEMFGAERGAFTDAVSRAGSFELASGGTLFLDEIDQTSVYCQAKLLRVLEEKAAIRVGGTRKVRLDCRVVAATNRDLRGAVHEGTFREDLFYRLAILTCRIPPLRERSEDIPVLAKHFVRELSQGEKELAPQAMERLEDYEWPGNVRELRNALERAVVLSPHRRIDAADVSFV